MTTSKLSLATLPSKIGKGSGEPRITDLCHKRNSGNYNQLPDQLTSLFVTSRAVRESGRKRRMAGVAEKRVALAVKEATGKLGCEDVKACQLDAGL